MAAFRRPQTAPETRRVAVAAFLGTKVLLLLLLRLRLLRIWWICRAAHFHCLEDEVYSVRYLAGQEDGGKCVHVLLSFPYLQNTIDLYLR